ncbi:amp dependent CoA ligase [Clavulina sp. PMI_390]|nr:amp dependent CoA ligase [Clavulina sp. PMI_390]
MIFTSALPLLPEHLRDDLTIPQFMLDSQHPLRAHRSPNNPWLIDNATGRSYDHEEVRERVFGLANALSALYGISEWPHLVLYSPNDIDYPVALWAIHRLGAIASCANPAYTASELEYQLRTTKAKFIITHEISLETATAAARALGADFDLNHIAIIQPPKLAHHPSSQHYKGNPAEPLAPARQSPPTTQSLIDRGLGDLNTKGPHFVERKLSKGEAKTKVALLSFSSGTTGRPKAVAISHYNVISNVIQHGATWRSNDPTLPWEDRRVRDGDVATAVLPMFHIYGLVVVLHVHVFMGVPLVVFPRYSFPDFLSGIVRWKITTLYVVPPQLVDLLKRPESRQHNLSHVRTIMTGAAPFSSTTDQGLRKMLKGVDLGQGYGMTETSTTVTMWPLTQKCKATPGSAGQLMPGWEAKIVKTDADPATGTKEELAGYDEPGELYVRGPSTALRYEGNEAATKETFLPDGWVRTGDQVRIAPNGDVFVVDRLKEVLKVKGNQVAPAELEGHLLGHPDVRDACVVGVPDEYAGELPFAFIALQPRPLKKIESAHGGAKAKAEAAAKRSIAKWVEDHKIKYKWLAGGIAFVEVIPKNPSGKLLRRLLRDEARKIKAQLDAQGPKVDAKL